MSSMSPQLLHALRQVLVMMVLAALGVLVEHQTGILSLAGVDPLWWPIIGSFLAAAVRFLEGLRDGKRAAEGRLIPSDVAYREVSYSRQLADLNLG